MALVAGIDSSTQSTKVVVVDADDGTIVAEGRAPHTVTGTRGARESDPDEWFRALGDALASTGRASEVRALSVGAQQHGLVVLDDHARPLRPAKLWNDTESAPQARALVEAFDGPEWWAEEVGVVPVASFTASKWSWLRDNEPGVLADTATVCLPHDYLNLRLTGSATTDRGDASGTAWFSTHHDRYLEEVLDHLGLDVSLLPDVLPAHVGEVSSAAATELGLHSV